MWPVVCAGLPWEPSYCDMLLPEKLEASVCSRTSSLEDIVQMHLFTGRTESLSSSIWKCAESSSVSGGGYMSHVLYMCVCPCFSLILIRISEYHLDRNLRVWEKLLATQLLGSVQWSKWKDTGMLISGSWHIQQQQSKQFASVKRRSEHCGNFGLAFIRVSVTWLQINANLVSVCWMCKYRTRLIVEFWGWYSYAYFGVERIWFACICQVFIFYIYLNNMNK